MSEHDELTGLALAVSNLTLMARDKIGHVAGAEMPSLEPRLRNGEAFWVAMTLVRRIGSHQQLVAEGTTALAALEALRLALSDMVDGKRAVIGGKAEEPVPVAAQKPHPAPGQVWSYLTDLEHRDVMVMHVGDYAGRERARVRNLLTDRTTLVLVESLMKPPWTYLRSES